MLAPPGLCLITVMLHGLLFRLTPSAFSPLPCLLKSFTVRYTTRIHRSLSLSRLISPHPVWRSSRSENVDAKGQRIVFCWPLGFPHCLFFRHFDCAYFESCFEFTIRSLFLSLSPFAGPPGTNASSIFFRSDVISTRLWKHTRPGCSGNLIYSFERRTQES